MCSRRALLFVLMYMVSFTNASAAQTLDQQRCFARDPDLSIGGCTAMIQSGRETPENLARAFSHRGLAYARKGQDDSAIQDLDQAIRLNPNDAEASSNRGYAYNGKREYDSAVEDFDQVIRLNPNDAEDLYNRGVALRELGQQARAAADFAKASQLNPHLPSP